MDKEIVQGMYYLKRTIMALQSAEQLPALMPLCERLVKAGIDCRVMLSEELLLGKKRNKMRSSAKPSADTSEQINVPQSTLYLTDDPQVYAVLAADFSAVLVYLHPGNQDADFGDARYALEEPEDTEPEYLERVYRRCCNLPWEILVTERCWLRETVEEDVDSFWKMYQEPELTRYTQRLYPTPEAERGYVREYRRLVYSFFEFGVWTVLDRQSGVVVGRAGLSVREGYDLPELGFVIGREWQGRGLAKEVCRGILEYAREMLGFDRIQVLVHEENAVSLHLCRRLGFRERVVSAAAGEPQGKQQDISRTASLLCQTEKEQDHGTERGEKKSICPSYMVEMEQNGQKSRFVYMVYESDGRAADPESL